MKQTQVLSDIHLESREIEMNVKRFHLCLCRRTFEPRCIFATMYVSSQQHEVVQQVSMFYKFEITSATMRLPVALVYAEER
jgi:hypothetical protein